MMIMIMILIMIMMIIITTTTTTTTTIIIIIVISLSLLLGPKEIFQNIFQLKHLVYLSQVKGILLVSNMKNEHRLCYNL